jgi:hypothetical protein
MLLWGREMSDMRRSARFTEAYLTRAIKAALKAKLQIVCAALNEGTILLISGDLDRVAISTFNPWNE